jgi:cytochrome c553
LVPDPFFGPTPKFNGNKALVARGVVLIASLWLVASTGGDGAVVRGAEPSDKAGNEFFEAKIRPLLVTHCYECHRGDEHEGGLQLDSLAAMQRGGESGPAVIAGELDRSLLIQAVRYTTSFYKMPPDGKLADEQIRDLERWVAAGAPVPDSFRQAVAAEPPESAAHESPVNREEARAFWAFQPIRDVALPAILDRAWCRTSLDYFIRASLEAAAVDPAPPADRRTWLRRVTYDLTGLPPTTEALERFARDRSPDARERVIEGLLASPAYGERWGRHWLDVARYADSNGLDENLAYANAFRYRDYVIRAWNADKPFDRFVQEQLAGDLLAASADLGRSDAARLSRADALTATAFLSLGPKMLACDDGRKMELDIIDEQVDTTARAFMGLTMGCARCHDHKFDPLSAADYYALAGIFKSTKTMENFNVVAVWHEHELFDEQQRQQNESWQKRRREIEQQLSEDKKLREAKKEAEAKVAADNQASTSSLLSDQQRKALEEERTAIDQGLASLPRVMGVCEGTPQDLPIHIRGNYLTLGEPSPRRFPQVLTGGEPSTIEAGRSGRLELAQWLTAPRHPLTARVIVNRVWLWHFGEGLVRSPDNFGRLGQRPTHPELLDHLARGLIEHNWSIKWLHRQILLSATYGMDSTYNRRAAEIDPENQLWWRMTRRRLSAEEVRDSLLAIAGNLDRQMGGQLMPNKNREYVTGTGSLEGTYDFPRRSVYLPILRSAVYNVFQAFDFGDPSVLQGQRSVTTVTPQALFMLNSQLVATQAAAIADMLLTTETDAVDSRPPPPQQQLEAVQIATAYQIILRRPPSAPETERAAQFLARYRTLWSGATSGGNVAGEDAAAATGNVTQAAFRGLCRSLIASSEFLYLD